MTEGSETGIDGSRHGPRVDIPRMGGNECFGGKIPFRGIRGLGKEAIDRSKKRRLISRIEEARHLWLSYPFHGAPPFTGNVEGLEGSAGCREHPPLGNDRRVRPV